MLCAPARICNAVSCEKYLFKEKADALGVTHCKCGKPFTTITYKPLPRGGNRPSSRAQGGPRAKAKAQAKPKSRPQAKAKAEPQRPWRKPQAGGTSSPAEQRSSGDGGHLIHKVDIKRTGDDVYAWTSLQEYTKAFPKFADLHDLAEKNVQHALAQKAQAMPPTQRVDHLRRRLKVETEELRKRRSVVEDTEAEIQRLRARLKHEEEGRDAQEVRVQQLGRELQQAEAALPTASTPKPVGRQLPDGDQGVEELLEQAKVIMDRKALSGRMTTEQREEYGSYDKGIRLLNKELEQERDAKADQEAADHKMALEMQRQEVQVGKHARDDFAHDARGDTQMDGRSGVAEEDDGFQNRRSRCRRAGASGPSARTLSPTGQASLSAPVVPDATPARGRVPVCPPGRRQEPGTSSATPQPSEGGAGMGPVGPLATVPRPKTPERRQDRARSPRRPAGEGTPADPKATGSLGTPADTHPAEPSGARQAVVREDDVMTSEVSSLSSKQGSREASPAAGGTACTVHKTSAIGLTSAENPGATEQPNERGGASTLT